MVTVAMAVDTVAANVQAMLRGRLPEKLEFITNGVTVATLLKMQLELATKTSDALLSPAHSPWRF